ncbi:TELO2-interacting protein 1 homolog isoform X1 [Monomorium pharaonis]|uniref:TELO2-interacting protein 1 homolog isoform X1 n=1 Tax=Monomorium pharaonis TaxID=307658 RepID=UPI00063F91A6|nr:TELO2-interacting protein 1 homolog isoform X1 [Monomorium pharaonis]XP_012531276.1 TELO2-interacting protein 1 homolog isoform X1 [Monomorium pharaonis]
MEQFDIQIFLELKSCCDNLIKNPNQDHAHRVAEMARRIPDKTMQDLSGYCLLPIITSLQSNSSITVKEELVKTLRVIIQKIRITKLKLFFDIYGSLLIQIFDKSQSNQVILFHEELKEAVALCIKDLVHQSITDVIESLYVKENVLKLGQGIFLCLTIARTEKSYAVRLAGIYAVMALCHIDDQIINKSDIIIQDQIANAIMAFFPGIVSGLQEIAMGSEVQNHKLTMIATQAWGRIISLVLRDKDEDTKEDALSIETLIKKSSSIPTDKSHNTKHNEKCNIEYNLKNGVRNKEWFDAVAVKLGVCIQLLDQIRSHSHYKVKRELVESISLILKNCRRNMKPNIMTLIDYLISLSEDESSEVSEKAHNVLHAISENYMQNYDMKSLIDSLEDKFYSLLTRLPTIIRRSDDNEQLAYLNQFAGYLRLFGKQRLPHIMKSQAHMQRLLLALVYIMVIDCNNVSLLQMTNVKDLDDPAYFYGSDLWKQFKFIKNSSCKEKLIVICKLLGEFGDFRILIDTILELMMDASQHRKELSLLLNWILVSVKDSSSSYLYKEIVDFYTTQEIWYLPTEVTEDTPLVQAQSNIVQCCLLIEGLGLIAQNLRHDYDRYLLKTLYLIIERAGSGNSLISYIGMRTLENVAEAQQQGTIGDLLRANVDYFSYHIIMKLRQVDRNPGVFDVIKVVMKYSRLDFLPHLKGIVEDVLRQLSTPYHQKNTCSFLKIFHTFIICIKTLINWNDEKIAKENAPVTNNPSEIIILCLLEYCNAKKINEKIEDDYPEGIESDSNVLDTELLEETNEDYLDSNAKGKNSLSLKIAKFTHCLYIPDKQDKKLPTHIKIIIEVMKRCMHFLPLKDVQKSLMAMQTLQEGLPILVEWEDELLPLVHQLWHPLTDRFNDENALVINHAWQLLHVLASISNDFIRSRTLREVLPSVFKFLTKSSKESINKSSVNIYKFTQTYKTQYELLSTLGIIARLLKLWEHELWQILSNTQMYLSARQHTALQTCCVKLYKDIADYNEDLAWVKCLSIWNSKVARIISDATFDMKNLVPDSSNEYYRNVNEIIVYIQQKSINY